MTPPIMPTRILIVGSGGREHALAWKLAHEPGVNDVIVAPGSDGIATEPRVTVVPGLDPLDGAAVVAVARAHAVELVVIGPEAPLAAGVADSVAAAGVPAFGPSREAARIESSKAFCREVADAAGVPMARGRAFATAAAGRSAALEIFNRDGAVVVKSDGLAAGKGVTVCDDRATLEAALARSGPIVVEERLVGREASVMAICDGVGAVALPVSRDHKRLGDGDHGPMTGGMGAYSPLADLPDEAADDLLDRFHRPVLRELARRGTPFRGTLYAGLMLTAAGPRLLEFNARFGDPETQVIVARLAVALGPLLLAAARGRLAATTARVPSFPGASVGVVLAADGYPESPRRGDPIAGLEDAVVAGAFVFHSGTRRDQDGTWRTNGGRVLTVVGRGHDLDTARDGAEAAASRIAFAGAQRRHDIGAQPATVTA